jgi:hypothetical protein
MQCSAVQCSATLISLMRMPLARCTSRLMRSAALPLSVRQLRLSGLIDLFDPCPPIQLDFSQFDPTRHEVATRVTPTDQDLALDGIMSSGGLRLFVASLAATTGIDGSAELASVRRFIRQQVGRAVWRVIHLPDSELRERCRRILNQDGVTHSLPSAATATAVFADRSRPGEEKNEGTTSTSQPYHSPSSAVQPTAAVTTIAPHVSISSRAAPAPLISSAMSSTVNRVSAATAAGVSEGSSSSHRHVATTAAASHVMSVIPPTTCRQPLPLMSRHRHVESKESIESTSNSSAIGDSSSVRPPHVASAPISSPLTHVAAAATSLVGSKRTRPDAPQPSEDSSSAIPTPVNERAKRPRVSPTEMTPPSAISDAPILSARTATSAIPHAATADVAVNANPHRVCTSLQPDAKAEQKVHEDDTNMEISDRPVAIASAAAAAAEPRPILPAMMDSVAETSESLDVTMIDSAAASADHSRQHVPRFVAFALRWRSRIAESSSCRHSRDTLLDDDVR